jgi:fido (protein-threonine AMPylation protein)
MGGSERGKQTSGGGARPQRDTTGSRFYCAPGLTPDETFSSIEAALTAALIRVRATYVNEPLVMTDGRLQSFHRIIFGKLFDDLAGAGRYRQAHEPTSFGVPVPRAGDWGMRTVRGAAHNHISGRLAHVFTEWNQWCTTVAMRPHGIAVPEIALSISNLYTGILRTHPFVDGNHRASFLVYAAALATFDLPLVEFATDEQLRAHDRAVGAAVVPDRLDPHPFAELLIKELEAA